MGLTGDPVSVTAVLCDLRVALPSLSPGGPGAQVKVTLSSVPKTLDLGLPGFHGPELWAGILF